MDSQVPIALVGMSCRFAGDVSDPEKLWQLCAEGRSAWSKIPDSRFNLDGVYHPNFANPGTVCLEHSVKDNTNKSISQTSSEAIS